MFKRIYRLSVYDESRLADIGSISVSKFKLVAWLLVIIMVLIGLGVAIAWFSPLKNNLPGYLKKSQRTESERAMIRLDSLSEVYSANQMYIDNLIKVLDTDRTPDDSVKAGKYIVDGIVEPDSLLMASAREREFASDVFQRDKYSLSGAATVAAEGIRFFPINIESIFTESSKTLKEGVIALPARCSINSISDGRIIEISTPSPGSAYTIVVQHHNGFLSKITGAGRPMVAEGDKVLGGQPLAMSPNAPGRKPATVTIRLWHNGTPLVPYDYIGNEDLPLDPYGLALK